MNNILDSMLKIVQNKLTTSEEKLYSSIRKGEEFTAYKHRGEIEAYQNIIRDIIKMPTPEDNVLYETLQNDRDMYRILYEKATKLVEDVLKENKNLTDKLCNIYR